MYAYAREGGPYPELSEGGVLLDPSHRRVLLQAGLAHPALLAPLLVFEPRLALLGPAPERFVNGVAVDAHVAGYRLDGPPLGVQGDHGPPALFGLGDPVVALEAPEHPQWHRLLGEDPFDGVLAGPPADTDVADGGHLAKAEAGVLCL